MKWTTERPTAPGFYWLRWTHLHTDEITTEVVRLKRWHQNGPLYVCCTGTDLSDPVDDYASNRPMWAGPIPEPEGT